MSTTQCVYYVCDDDDDDGVSRRDEYELRSPTAVTFGAVGITLPLCRYKPNCLMTEAQCVWTTCPELCESETMGVLTRDLSSLTQDLANYYTTTLNSSVSLVGNE